MKRFRRGAAPTPRFIARGSAAIRPWHFATVPSRCLGGALRCPPYRQRPAALPRRSHRLACEQSRSMALVTLGDAPRPVSGIAQFPRNRSGCADQRVAGISEALRQGCSPSVLAACTWAVAVDRWPSVVVAHAQVRTAAVEPALGLIECPFRPQGSGAWYPIAKIRSSPDMAASLGTCPRDASQLQLGCSRSPRRWSAVSRSRSSQATPPQPLCARS